MKHAPKGATFVWVNHDLGYPKKLAVFLGRGDLRIEGPGFLEYKYKGTKLKGLVVDHAARLTDEQYEGFQQARFRIDPTTLDNSALCL